MIGRLKELRRCLAVGVKQGNQNRRKQEIQQRCDHWKYQKVGAFHLGYLFSRVVVRVSVSLFCWLVSLDIYFVTEKRFARLSFFCVCSLSSVFFSGPYAGRAAPTQFAFGTFSWARVRFCRFLCFFTSFQQVMVSRNYLVVKKYVFQQLSSFTVDRILMTVSSS